MIREFPADHELVAFFEEEPTVRDQGIPWLYNTLDFATTRHEIEVHCRFVPSYGKLTARVTIEGAELATYELRGVEAFRLVIDSGRETLVAMFPPALKLDNFALQLKPRVWAAWGNLHQLL